MNASRSALALKLKCPRCKAAPEQPCISAIPINRPSAKPYRLETYRPHNERFAKLRKAERLLVAKHLRITVPELDRRMTQVQRTARRRMQAYEAMRDFELAERDQLRAWLSAFAPVLWAVPGPFVSDDVTNDAHPPLSGA